MSAQEQTNNFMTVLSQHIRDIAVVELFGGLPDRAVNKLALDFVVPISWEAGEKYSLQLVARLSYVNDQQKYVQSTATIGATYTADMIRKGPSFWAGAASALANPLVSALKVHTQKLNKVKFLTIQHGEMVGSPHNMKRIWIS